ncbi:MazF family toxin-antitoxin system [Limosilactobacillus reuteri]|uniref:MazF family toxin-antitoxin system n=1 Tax=Limosilactobacillus reuteri TaxID=1598 RepID=UPI00214B165A|nr:MazF family toxin-antitoxin system [Limosilactobacillus reuteri]MCR1879486.1 MazF family toxin-antitoxin system [Limosilactobacillus reuteri]
MNLCRIHCTDFYFQLGVFSQPRKYKNKSERIKKNYFPLMDWKIEGLDKQSYVDVGDIIKLSKEHVSFRLIGELSTHDIEALVEFIRNRYEI